MSAHRVLGGVRGGAAYTRTMSGRIGLELAQPRFAMVLLAAFAGLLSC